MTVPSSSNRMEYTGNGVASVFDYTFQIFDNTDLQVYVLDTDGVQTQLALTTDFTVSGAGEPDGGSITLVAGALTTDYELTILREVPLTQEVDLRNQGAYYPETVETMGDRLMMGIQQIAEKVTRTLQFRPSDDRTTAPKTNQLPVPQTGYALSWNADGNLENVQLAAINYDIIITGGDAGKVVKVNATDNGIEVGATYTDANTASTIIQRDTSGRAKVSNPSAAQDIATKDYVDSTISGYILLPGDTVSLSVETSPVGETQFSTIKAALDFVRTNYISAGGLVTITVNKTGLTSADDKIEVSSGEVLSHVEIVMAAGSYDTGASVFISVPDRGICPVIKASGTVTFAAGSPFIFVGPGSSAYIASGTWNTSGTIVVSGGELVIGLAFLVMTSSSLRCLQMVGGKLDIQSAGSLTVTTTSGSFSALDIDQGASFMSKGALVVNGGGGSLDSILVSRRSSFEVNTLTGTTAAGKVAVKADSASLINLSNSTATCNLTDNTVSGNGILIR